MTDQVSPISGLASGLPVASVAGIGAGSTPIRDGSAKIADPSTQGQGGPVPAVGSPDKAVEQINNHLRQASTQLQVQVDSDTGKTIYKVVDPSTGQVVIQVPSAQVLAMAHTLQAMDKQQGASGVLIDKKG
ncbi:MAG: flagellar protein FlaG [Geothrix sp.]|nr:flagellar protein FlaG [Geothrix sp.]